MAETELFETLADPTRRRIVSALAGGALAVNDIVDAVDIHQSGVSRHLRILHDAGFVAVRAAGKQRIYSLRPEPFRDLEAWLRDYQQLMQQHFAKLDAHLERMKKAVKP